MKIYTGEGGGGGLEGKGEKTVYGCEIGHRWKGEWEWSTGFRDGIVSVAQVGGRHHFTICKQAVPFCDG